MKNIVLVGMKYESNLGDRLIYECMDTFLQDYFLINMYEKTDVRFIDMSGKEEYIESSCEEIDTKTLTYKIKKNIRKIAPQFILKNRQIKRKNSRIDNLKVSLRSLLEKKVDNNTQAIIFAGGGVLKYKYQDFHICIDVITKYAEQLDIPVMFSGVGVEGYDDTNKDCMILKKALNRNCVKMITTRDDINLLNDCYISNNTIKTYLVADPACSTSLIRPVKRLIHDNKIIGIGIAREQIFVDNGIEVSKENLFKIYSDLIKLISKKGYGYFFFTTGTIQDQIFAEKIKEHLGLNIEIAKRPENIDEFIDIINQCDLTIVCRLHASIVSYSYNIPTIAFVWNKKQRFFGRIIGHEERFLDVNEETLKKLDVMIDDYAQKPYFKTEEYINSTKTRIYEFLDEFIELGKEGHNEA